jgi:GDP-L-fucose synthase
MRKVLVTGGYGFLGTHVVRRLRDAGYDVVASTHGNPDNYNLCWINDIHAMLEAANPEIVVHLAARVGGIGANQANPATFFYDNLMMGVQLMHESYLRGVKKFLTLATICSYPKFTKVPFCETDLWNGYPEETNAPYGLAKKMLLVQAQAYRQQYGFNAVVLFPVNLYGPGDNFDLESSHVIPAMIRKFVEAKKRGDMVELWGDGSPTREFLYVEDCAEAIAQALAKYDGAEPVNIGSGNEVSIRSLAGQIAALVGYKGGISWDHSKPNGQPRRCLDVSRARNMFGFEAKTELHDGLRKTLDWYMRDDVG